MNEIDIKHRISLNGFIEQDLPYQCPECREELTVKNIIGFGEYPKGGYRANLKPNKNIGVGFECPKCFEKNCFHSDKYVYQMYTDNIAINNR